MPNPSTANRRGKAGNIEQTAVPILTPPFTPKQDRRARSPQPEVRQLNLLALLDNPQKEPALRIEAVPAELIVNSNRCFWIIHQKSELRVPGQFSRQEAERILETTKEWDWSVDSTTREPAYKWRLLSLLEYICSSGAKLEVAA